MNEYKVLVIDDSTTMYKIIAKNLESKGGVVVDYAPNGSSGIKISKAKNYDLITIDIDMPGIDGFQTVEEISKENPDQKFLFISSKYNDENIEKAKKIGVPHFLPKPFTSKVLTNVVFILLESGD